MNLHNIMEGQIVDDLLKILSTKAELKKEGFLTGAAVASAMFEYSKNGVKPVYNDLDFFIVENQAMSLLTDSDEEKTLTSLYLDVIENNEELNFFIFKSEREGLINTTKMTVTVKGEKRIKNTNSVGSEIWLKFISSFDFNYVQIGIDVENKTLYMSNHFIEFMKTKQLNISNFKTPSQTAIRLFKKLKELDNTVFVNKDLLINKLSLSLFLLDSTKFKDTPMILHYGEIMQKRFLNMKMEVEAYFVCMRERTIYNMESRYYLAPRSDKINLISTLAFYELGDQYNNFKVLYTDPREMLKLFDFNFFASSFQKRQLKNAFAIANEFDKKNNTNYFSVCLRDNMSKFMYQKSLDENTLTRIFNIFKRNSDLFYLFNKMTFDEVYKLFNIIWKTTKGFDKESKEIAYSSLKHIAFDKLSFNDVYDIFDIVGRIGKKMDKENRFIAYGLLETFQFVNNDFVISEKIFKEKIDILTEKLQKILTQPLPYKNTTCHNLTSKELITGLDLKKEGLYMGHCVAGYAFSVEKGFSKIIHIEDLTVPFEKIHSKIFKHATVEIKINKDEKSINQIKHKFNGNPTKDFQKRVLKHLNEKYNFDLKIINNNPFF